MAEEVKIELPSVRRSCGDCVYCRGFISLWCMNPAAVKIRGSRIPGICHCPFWEKSRWYDDGWGFVVPEQPNRIFRIIRFLPFIIKRRIRNIKETRKVEM